MLEIIFNVQHNKHPQFIMVVLALAKNGDEQFWK